MQTRIDSAGRVQPIEYRNLATPGQCLLCARIGRLPEEVFANLGVELDFYGLVYLCLDCCAEVASFICFVDPKAFNEATYEINKLKDANRALLNQLKEAKGLINARIDTAGVAVSNSTGAPSIPVLKAQPKPTGVN